MAKKYRPEMDNRQMWKDFSKRGKGYELDTRFLLNDGESHPLAVLCPGGGYELVCSFVEGTPIAKELNEKGISVAIVYYSTSKKAKYPAPQEDLARAIRDLEEMKDTYHYDMDRYSLWGASAGGHLAASFSTKPMGYQRYGVRKPHTLILEYPVITMDPSFTHMGSHDNLLGKNATRVQEEATSVEAHVDKDYPRTFVWCGSADDTVDTRNTKELINALQLADVEHEAEFYENVIHGVGTGKGSAAEGWIDKAVEFWLKG